MIQEQWTISIEEKASFASVIYQSIYNAMQLAVVRDHGQDDCAEMMFRFFRRHQHLHFLPGLHLLGIDKEPTDAIAAAKYHYFSNGLGGMHMEYVEETPEKVWIRYRAPYLWEAVPDNPSVMGVAFNMKPGYGPYKGWHAENGVSLGNPRLGFVLTQSCYRGDPYDGGYFKLYDHDLEPEERFQVSPGEQGPLFDPAKAPKLPFETWPKERIVRAQRNYAVEYVGVMTACALDMYGPIGARPLVELSYKSALTQRYREIAKTLQIVDDIGSHWGPWPSTDVRGVAILLQRLAGLIDEEVTIEEAPGDKYILRQNTRSSRYMPDVKKVSVQVDEAIVEAWKAMIWLFNPEVTVDMTSALTAGDPYYEWVVRPGRSSGW